MRIPHTTKNDFTVALENINLKDNDEVQLAIEQAEMSHEDQLRDDGSSYLEQHIFPVAILVIQIAKEIDIPITKELIISSLLHDAMEDDEAFTEDVVLLKFNEEILSIIKPLTKKDIKNYSGKDIYEKKMNRNKEYINSILNSSIETKIIKIADRLSNLMSLPTCTDLKKREFMIEETRKCYLPIAEIISKNVYSEMKSILQRYDRLSNTRE